MPRRTNTKTNDRLRERVLEHLAIFRIPIAPAELDAALRRAEKQQLSHLHLLDELLGQQAARRRERSTERRISNARFPQRKTLETFDWDFNSKAIDRVQIEQLATCDFVRRRDNLILVGQSGVGKSHIVQALGIRACAAGFPVRYATSATLIAELNASLADQTLPRALRKYTRPSLLLIDEFGFDRIERAESPEAASLLYKVIAARSNKASTALVTNIDFDAWAAYLGDAPLSMALLDRLVENAIILKINGRSYRAAKAKRRTKARAHTKTSKSTKPSK